MSSQVNLDLYRVFYKQNGLKVLYVISLSLSAAENTFETLFTICLNLGIKINVFSTQRISKIITAIKVLI